jgi:hypothetical protein
METLHDALSIFHMPHVTPTEGDLTRLELALGQFDKLRKELQLGQSWRWDWFPSPALALARAPSRFKAAALSQIMMMMLSV